MIDCHANHDKTQFYIFLTAYAQSIKWYEVVMEWPEAFTLEEVKEAKYLFHQDQLNKNFMNKKAAHY